jgi:hypothetical protein
MSLASQLYDLWKALGTEQRFDKPTLPVFFKANGDPTFVSPTNPLPTTATLSGNVTLDPNGIALEVKQDDIIVLLTAIAGYVDGLEGKDYATQATLAAVLAKLIATPATEAKQDTLIAKDFATQTTLAAVLAKIISAPATEAKQDVLNAKDFATQVTLAAVLAKLSADPATQTTLAAVLAKLSSDPATQTTLDLVNTALKTLVNNRTVFDNQKSVYSIDHISVNFNYNLISSRDIITTGTIGTGTVTASGNMMVANTGASSGTVVGLTQDHLRYINGHEFEGDMTMEWDTGFTLASGQFMFGGLFILNAANNGIESGFGVGYYNHTTDTAGQTVFGQWRYKSGTLTFIKQADFAAALNTNGIGNTGRTWNTTEANKGAIFQFKGGFLGKAPLICGIHRGYDNAGNKLFNDFSYVDFSATKGVNLSNTHLRMGVMCNGGNNNIMRVGSINGKVWTSHENIARRSFVVPPTAKSTISAEVPILAIANGTTYNSIPNAVEILLHMLMISQTSGAQIGNYRFYKGGTLTGGAFVSFGSDSVSTYNITATAYSGGAEVFPLLQSSNGASPIERDFLNTPIGAVFKCQPGEQIVITASSGANMNINFGAGILEYF